MHTQIRRNFLSPTGQREDCISDTKPTSSENSVYESRPGYAIFFRDSASVTGKGAAWNIYCGLRRNKTDSGQTDSGDSILTARDGLKAMPCLITRRNVTDDTGGLSPGGGRRNRARGESAYFVETSGKERTFQRIFMRYRGRFCMTNI